MLTNFAISTKFHVIELLTELNLKHIYRVLIRIKIFYIVKLIFFQVRIYYIWSNVIKKHFKYTE